MVARVLRVVFSLAVLVGGLFQAQSALAQSITSYQLVSETRPTRTDSILTYRVTVSNPGGALASATATASTSTAGITLLDNAVSFGPVPAGATAQSTDTFQFRINRTIATITASTFQWNISSAPVIQPTVTINQAAGQADPTGSSPILFSVVFSSAVTGFTASDVSFAGSTVGGSLAASVSGSGAIYTVSVTGMGGAGTVVATIPGGAASDAVTSALSQASTSTDNSVVFDGVAPAAVINQAAGQADPTNSAPIQFSVIFSKSVSGFTASDVSFAGSTVGGTLAASVSGSGAVYTVSVTGMGGAGAVVASIPAGAATDAVGNASQASTSTDNSVVFDGVAPAVVINQAAGQADPTNSAPIQFSVIFSKSVSGFTASDVSFAGSTVGGTLAASVSGSGAVYTVSVTGMGGAGAVVASIPAGAATDAVGNASQASTSADNSVVFDGVAPAVVVNQAAGQADPTNSAPIQFSVIFSESVSGFTASDVNFAGSTVGGSLAASVSGSGAIYTVSVTGMAGNGTVVVSIPAGAATDAAGNASQASTSTDNSVTFNASALTVTINQGAGQADPTSVSPVQFAVSFSAAVTGFTAADVSFAGSTVGGSLAASVSGSGAIYTVSVTGMAGNGMVVASIPAGAATDAASNSSQASSSTDNVVVFDGVAPAVVINQAAGQADPTGQSPIAFSVAFSESVSGFTAADVSFAGSTVGGSLAASVSGSGAIYTVSVTGMAGNGTVVASIPAGAATDAASNSSQASSSTDNVVVFDGVAPAVVINQAAGQADPTGQSPIAFSVAFSESVSGFTAADVSFAGSTVGGSLAASVSGSGAIYTVSVSGMTGTGTVVASIPAGAAADSAGNASTASTSTDNSVTYDAAVPSVTINQAAGQSDPASSSPILFSVVFSEPVTGFTAADVGFAGSTVGGSLAASVSGSGAIYTVSVSGMTGTGTVVASIPAGAADDSAGNASTASTSTDNSVTFDPSVPTVTINQAAGQADPTTGAPVLFTAAFGEPVIGFTGADISFAGSTVGGTPVANISGAGPTYTVSVSGFTGSGVVVVSIPAGAVTDTAGNPNSASVSTDNSVTVDSAAPTVTINQASGQADPTNGSPIQFTVVFSEPVSGFAPSDISFSGSTVGGTLAASIAGSGPGYTVSVTGMSGTGTVVASIGAGAAADGAGNASGASTSTDNTVTFDATIPSVTINQAAAQADPTSSSPVQFSVVFSEPVTGFTSGDVDLSGSTVGGTLAAAVSGSGATYTVSVTGMSGIGAVVASIPAGAVSDAAGNASTASTSTDNVVSFDNQAPSVTINQASGQADPTNASPVQFTVIFSEGVTGFTSSDISFAGSTVGGTLAAAVSGSGNVYTVSVTGMSGTGLVVASIPAGAAQDSTGNASGVSASTDNSVTFDSGLPSVTINQAAGQADPTNQSPIAFSIVFSEPVTGFTAADISFSGSSLGTLSPSLSGSGAAYTLNVTGMAGTGTVVVSIPAGAAQDSAGNQSTAATSTDNTVTFDGTGPRVTLSTPNGTASTAFDRFTLHFSEAIQAASFTLADVASLTGPGGAITPLAVNATSATSAEVTFASQSAAGTYTLVVGPNILDGVGNQMDQNQNGSNGEATADQYTAAYTIGGVASIASIAPNSGVQGQTNMNVIVTGQFTSFVNGVTTAGVSGTGVAVNSVTVTSSSTATVNVDISATAALGARVVTMTTGTEVVSSSATGTYFTVTQSAATLSQLSPNTGRQAQSLTVNITGSGTHFATGTTSAYFGPYVNVTSLVINSATSATAGITIGQTTPTGIYTVTLTTGGEQASLVNGFTVQPGLPAVQSVTPATGHQAQTLNVALVGQFTNWAQGVTTASFGAGITVNGLTVSSATTASANVMVTPGASLGSRTVTLTTNSEVASLVGGFTVTPGVPTLLTATPAAGTQGQSLTVALTGAFTNFTGGVTTASFGSGITVGTVTVNGPGDASVPITIQSGAVIGTRSIALVTGSEVATLTNGFTVNQGVPILTAITPNAGQVGNTINVTIDGLFTNWQQGVTSVSYGSGVTVNSNTVNGPTQVGNNITIAAGAGIGPRDVVVTTGSEVLTVVGGFQVTTVDTTAPSLVRTSPVYGATDVPLNVAFTAEFNEPLDRSTVTPATFMLYDSQTGLTVPGTVAVDATGRVITFTPSQLLAVRRSYYAYMTGALKDVAGNPYASSAYYFSTGFAVDTTGPTLTHTNPLSGDAAVAINTKVTLRFDKPINTATQSTGILVQVGGSNVAGTYAFTDSNRLVTFTSASPFASSTAVTVTVNSLLLDVAGNPVTNPTSFTFVTGAATDTTGATVTAFTPDSGETGAPLNTVMRVDYNELISPVSVAGNAGIYLYDQSHGQYIPVTVAVTPNRMGLTLTPLATLRRFTQYYFQVASVTDLAGNYAGSVGGYFTTTAAVDTVAPTVATITPPNGTTLVPVNAKVVVTMSETIDDTVLAGSIQLTPAVAGNIVLGTDKRTLTFTPTSNLAASTTYAVQVSGLRDLDSNTMAPFSASFQTSGSAAADTTAPTVTISPNSGVQPVNTNIVWTTSERIAAWAVGPNSMPVLANLPNQGYVQVAGSYSINAAGTVVTFTPSNPFPGNITMLVYSNYDSSIRDMAGNTLQYASASFTTSTTIDSVAPTVLAVTPVDGAVDIGPQAVVTLTFSESLSPATVSNNTFTLFADAVELPVSVTRSLDNKMVFLGATLPLDKAITVVATSDVQDLSGNRLADFSSVFYTSPAILNTTASIVTQRPVGSNVPAGTTITLFANQALDPTTVPGVVHIAQNGTLVAGTVTLSGNGEAILFTPSGPFVPGALVQVFVAGGATDIYGNVLNQYQDQFNVTPDTLTAAPTFVSANPYYTSNNPVNSVVNVLFSEPLDPTTVTSANVYMRDASSLPVSGTLSLSNGDRAVTFTPSAPLQANSYVYLYLTNGLRDLQNQQFAGTNFYFYTGTGADTTAPAIVQLTPQNGAAGVGVNAVVTVRFSEPIDPLTASPATISLTSASGSIPVTLALSSGNQVLTASPLVPLPDNGSVTVSINGIRDQAGNPVAPATSQFATGTDADTVRPSVVSVNFPYGGTGVPVNAVFEVSFNEPVDPQSVLAQQAQFLYDSQLGYLPGTFSVSPDGRTYTFVPAATLAVNRSFSLNLSVAVDYASNQMTGFGWPFSTSYQQDTTAPQVVGVNPVSNATAVPRNAKVEILFDEPVKLSSLANVTLLRGATPEPITPVLSNGNRTLTLTPAALLTANSAYTISVAGVRDIAGNVVAATFTSSFTTNTFTDLVAPTVTAFTPAYGDTGVPTNVTVQARFSEPVDPVTISASTFHVANASGGGYLPVTVTLAADRLSAMLTPVSPLAGSTQYYAQLVSYTDPSGNVGNAAASYFMTGSATDGTPPNVVSIAPAAGQTGVPVNAKIVVRFSEPMASASLTSASMSLTPAVAGSSALSADGLTLTFTPTAPLAVSQTYSVQVTGLRDRAANIMTAFNSTFTTGASSTSDTTAPTITSTSPVQGASGVSVTSAISFTLSEPIDSSFVDANSMAVYAALPSFGYLQVAGTYSVTSGGTVVTFTPSGPYPANTTINWYSNANSTIRDLAGNLVPYQSWSFTTGNVPDTTAPTVTAITPANGTTNVGPQAVVTLTFSESVLPSTAVNANIGLFAGSNAMAYSLSRSADNRMLFLSTSLPANTLMTVVVTAGVTDLSSNPLASEFVSSFTTAPAFDFSGPSIITQRPSGSSVLANSAITLFSNQPLNPATVPGALFVSQNGVLVAGTTTVSASGTAIKFVPAAPFTAGAFVNIAVTTDAQDTAGNPMSAFAGQFTVAADTTTTAPTLVDISPVPYNQGINPVNSVFEARFNESLDATTVTAANVYLRDAANNPVTATISLRDSNRVVRLTPATTITPGSYVYLYLANGLKDVQGTAFSGASYYFYATSATDTTAPSAALAPATGSTGVGVNAEMRVTFSERVNPLTADASTVALSSGGTIPTTFSWSVNNTVLTVTPTVPLPGGASVAFTVNGVQDLAGNAVASTSSTFTTANVADITSPTATPSIAYGEVNVPVNVVIEFTFDEPIDPPSALSQADSSFYSYSLGAYVAGGSMSVSPDGRVVTYVPPATLNTSSQYSFGLSSARDLAGNLMNAVSTYFVTGTSSDTTAPQVAAVNPGNTATAARRNSRIEILFNESIDPNTVSAVQVLVAGNPIALASRTLTNGNRTLTLTPATLLAANTPHTISIAGITDVAGNAMTLVQTVFVTGTTTDLIAPANPVFSPANNATSVPVGVAPTVTFAEPIDPVTVLSAPGTQGIYIRLRATSVNVPATVTFSPDFRTVTITPSSPLAAGTQYDIVSFYVYDQAGNLNYAFLTSGFTTQ